MTLLYAEDIHMLKRLEDKKLEKYLDEKPRILPLFDIDVVETEEAYNTVAPTAE